MTSSPQDMPRESTRLPRAGYGRSATQAPWVRQSACRLRVLQELLHPTTASTEIWLPSCSVRGSNAATRVFWHVSFLDPVQKFDFTLITDRQGQGKARQGKARQGTGKARQGKARQGLWFN